MKFEILQLIIDFGLVILIWLVQLCIYPAFTFFSEKNLLKWHKAYTPRITFVVLPLMLSQLILSIYFLNNTLNIRNLLIFSLVITTWATTFLIYVPLHQKINTGEESYKTSNKLVKLNWVRLVLWNLVFVINCYFLFFS